MSYFENTRNEDAAHVTTDPGVMALAVRKATPANLSGTDGDYEPLQVSAGKLWTSATIDSALPAGTNNIGDIDVLSVPSDPFGLNADAASATGSISAKLRFIAGTGIPVTGTVTVGTHAVTQSGTWNIGSITTLPALVAGTANIGDVDVLTVPADPFGVNADAASATGSISAKLRFIASTGIPITGTVTVGSHAVTIASGAGAFVHLEDDASANLDGGAGMLAVRKATPANTSGADGDYEFLQMSAGRLWASVVVDSALPTGANVIGAVTQSGTWNIGSITTLPALVAGTANIGDVDVLTVPSDPFGANADAASATGSISAKLRFIASTGIPITGTVTVGSHAVTIASGASSFVHAEDDASGNLDAGAGMLAVRKATPANTSGADGDYEFLQMSAGRLWASATIDAAIPAGTNNIGDVDVLTVPTDPFGANADAASATGSISAKLRFIASTGIPITGTVTVGSHAVTNAGTFVVQIDGAALTSLQLVDDIVYTDDAAFTVGTSKVTAVGLMADETSTDSVDEGDIGLARMTLDRKQITAVYAHTTGGWTPYVLISAASTNATSVKGSAGQVGVIVAFNLNASARYLKLYNKASAPTVGTDTPVQVYMIPGNTTGAGFVIPPTPGLDFTTGIAYALTTGIAHTDTGAVAANELIVNLGYK